MSDGLPGPDTDGLLTDLRTWADDEQAAAGARSRSRQAWLRQQAAESTTLLGVLVTLAEHESPVTVRTAAGAFVGMLSEVTGQVCTIDLGGSSGGVALIAVSAITAVEGGQGDIADDRLPEPGPDLATVLAGLACDRPLVRLHVCDGTEVGGALTNVGVDLVSIRCGPDPAAVVHVALRAVAVCVLI